MRSRLLVPVALVLFLVLAWGVWAVLRLPADAQGGSGQADGAVKATAGKEPSARSSGAETVKGQDGPRIFFPEAEHDFGRVSRGESVTHAFKVRNTGEAPLRLISAKGS